MSAQEHLTPGSLEWQALEALALANVDLSTIGDGMPSWRTAKTSAIAALQMSYALARSKGREPVEVEWDVLRLDRYLYGLEQCERGYSPRPRTRRIARHANYLCVPGGCHDNTAWGPRGGFTHKIGQGYGPGVVDVLSDLGRERLARERARGVEFEF